MIGIGSIARRKSVKILKMLLLMASALKVERDMHFACGASEKSQLAATGMQLNVMVRLHMRVNATRNTDRNFSTELAVDNQYLPISPVRNIR